MFWPLSCKESKESGEKHLAGETLAMLDGTDNAMFLTTLFSEHCEGDAEHAPPITCVTGNHALTDALKSTKHVFEKTKG